MRKEKAPRCCKKPMIFIGIASGFYTEPDLWFQCNECGDYLRIDKEDLR